MELAPRVFEGVKQFVRTNHIDLVVHGGDLVDHGTECEIRDAIRFLADLEVPVAYCLGNHDLGTPTSFDLWTNLPHPPSVSRAECVVSLDGLDVVMVNNTWFVDGVEGMFWKAQTGWQERIAMDKMEWLDRTLARHPHRPAILVIHTPPDPIPPRLTGLPDPIHAAFPPYITQIDQLLSRHQRVKLVLSGHNHVTMATRHGERVHSTTSSLVEPPFEFRVIDFNDDCLQVNTLAAVPMADGISYECKRTWANGSTQDREFKVRA